MIVGCENLAILHRIVHFDLKSANVLLGRDWTAKIADVGLAKILKDGWLSTLREVPSAPACRPGYSASTSKLYFLQAQALSLHHEVGDVRKCNPACIGKQHPRC